MNFGASSIRKKWLQPSNMMVREFGSRSDIHAVQVGEQIGSYAPAMIRTGIVIPDRRSSVSCSWQAQFCRT